jgi:hypothetical protein
MSAMRPIATKNGEALSARGKPRGTDHGLKHRQAAGRQANTSADHHTVISLGLEPPLHVGSGCSIGPK